jgi:glycosyltransferase involved in cell wall biosynthesis
MRVCIVIDDYLPNSIKVGAKMMHELAVDIVARGHHVTVITPAPSLGQPYQLDCLDGVTVCRFRSRPIKNISKIQRAINESLLSFQGWRILKQHLAKNPHDLVVFYSPSIFFGIFVRRVRKLWGAKSYLVLRDFFPQWVIDNGMLKSYSPVALYFRFFEWLSYSAADVIGVQSPANIAVFRNMSGIDRPLEVLYNWAAEIGPVGTSCKYRDALELHDKVVFFYGGNIGAAQDMMNIVRLAQGLMNDPRAHFLLVGRGDEVELVERAIEKEQLNNMTLLPAVSQDEYVKLLSEFDVGLFSLHPAHSAHNFPGKLLGYMAFEKPILGSVNPDNDLQVIIEAAQAGFICVNGDDDGLLQRARNLVNDARLRATMGENSKALLKSKFSVAAAASQLLAHASK